MTAAVPARTRLVIGPNASLTGPQALVFMASVSTVSLAVAVGFALKGFWPILPFAGLELAALGAGLWVSLRRNGYREVVSVDGPRLRVEFGMVGRGALSACEMSRDLTRAWIERDAYGSRRLILSCKGQRLELGRDLSERDRVALCARLKELLRPGWVLDPAGAGLTLET